MQTNGTNKFPGAVKRGFLDRSSFWDERVTGWLGRGGWMGEMKDGDWKNERILRYLLKAKTKSEERIEFVLCL